jgi:hypothetical protein
MLKVALVAPAGIVTVAGTVATPGLLEASDTEMPPLGATPLSFTVPVEVLPPTSVVGVTDSKYNDGGVTVRFADFIETPLPAVIVTGVEDETGMVVTLNVPLVAPAGMVMLDGTPATEGSLEVKATLIPPEYAGALSVTVP